MIKVCHMTSAHDEEDVRIFHKECVSLANAGYDVYLVERGESYEKSGVHIVGVGDIPASRRKRMTEGAKRVYKAALALDADIYHFHDPELLPYGVKLKRAGKQVIFDSHEHAAVSILDKVWLSPLIRYPIHWAYDVYESYICRRLDAVITVTPHIAEYFQKRGSRTYLVANYPMLVFAAAVDVKKHRQVVFAGGINEEWNHEAVIQAVENIPDCRYILCGGGKAEYLRQLKALSGWRCVDFLGKIRHEQVASLLQESSVGIALSIPCRNSGWQLGTMGNTKIFEEMMAGLPIVCTDFTLWREFVDRYHCGICVDPTDVDAIASAIRYLLDHPDEARQMGENGRKAVKEEFNWSVEEKKMIELYEQLAVNIIPGGGGYDYSLIWYELTTELLCGHLPNAA